MTKRATKTYPLEFKQSSAKLALESNQSVSKTAAALGVNMTTLHGWIAKYQPSKQSKSPEKNALSEENKRLRAEVARVTQERDILKKAAAYFAREV
jgi:transposase